MAVNVKFVIMFCRLLTCCVCWQICCKYMLRYYATFRCIVCFWTVYASGSQLMGQDPSGSYMWMEKSQSFILKSIISDTVLLLWRMCVYHECSMAAVIYCQLYNFSVLKCCRFLNCEKSTECSDAYCTYLITLCIDYSILEMYFGN